MARTVSPNYSDKSPSCPKCVVAMVRRTAQRGPNKGKQFWGCPRFPKCRGMITKSPPKEPANPDQGHSSYVEKHAVATRVQKSRQDRRKRPSGLTSLGTAVDRLQRWRLESDEPDATGRWDREHGRRVLRYIYKRDQGRCGLCGGEMKIKGAHIEHIVPKVFALFDVHKGGKVVEGTRYKSLLHKLDNLQAAHTYCNKRKGNSPEIRKWRHPSMPSLAVAVTQDGEEFKVPSRPARANQG